MSRIILSAFADEYSPSLDEQFEAMRRYGIGNIEIRNCDGKNVSLLSDGEIEAVKKKLEKYGVSISAVGSPIGKIRLDEDINAHLAIAKRMFGAAEYWGAKYVRVFSFYAPEGKNIVDMKDEVFDVLGELVALARGYGVTLCHENEARIYGDVPKRCLEILEKFGGELKCVFDMGNFVLEGVEPYSEAYELLKKYIAYFHIKDALAEGVIVPPGKGDAKIKEILEAHKKYSENDFFTTLEPHLIKFVGLGSLVGREFGNTYRYADAKEAFGDAVKKFGELGLT